MKPYKNFIVSGCSFTAGVINPSNVNEWTTQSFAWPHYCFLEMDPENSNFLNFALPGGGNNAALSNLIYYLELHKEVNSTNTLVGLNFTGLERSDSMCYPTHLDANKDVSNQHIKEQLDIGWIHGGGSHSHFRYGRKSLMIQSCLSIVQGIGYLESRRIDYFFMLMTDSVYTASPLWFKEFIDARKSNWVQFDNTLGMMEFVKQHQLTQTSTDFHPSKQGHKVLSDYVLKHLNKHDQT